MKKILLPVMFFISSIVLTFTLNVYGQGHDYVERALDDYEKTIDISAPSDSSQNTLDAIALPSEIPQKLQEQKMNTSADTLPYQVLTQKGGYEIVATNIPSLQEIQKLRDSYPVTNKEAPFEAKSKGALEQAEINQGDPWPTEVFFKEESLKKKSPGKKSKMPLGDNQPLEDSPGPFDNVIIDVMELKNMNIMDVLKLISQKSGLNIIAGKNVQGNVSIYLKDVKLKDVLRIVLDANNLAYKIEDGIARVMPAKEFEMRYGYPFGGDIQTRIIHMAYADAADVVPILNQIKSSIGKIIADPKSNTLVIMDSPDNLIIMKNLIREIDIVLETKVYELSYAKAKDISQQIEEALTKGVGRIKSDERTNKLIVTDTPEKMGEIAQLIETFDVKEREVLIEAKIMQVVLSDQHKFGVDWESLVSDYQNLDFRGDFDILSASEKRGSLNIGSLGTLTNNDYKVMIEALESMGTTNILSSPSITSLNNREAKILVGSTEPYVTSTTTTPASGPTTISESVNFIDVGVKLYVTPTIHKDDFITMTIKPEVSSVTQTVTTSNNNTIPVVETSEAEATVMVKDGVTIVIGGLIKEERIESVNKVPLLGDIPLLGYAFRNNDELYRKTEIVIFLTPRIITGDVQTEKEEDFFLRPATGKGSLKNKLDF